MLVEGAPSHCCMIGTLSRVQCISLLLCIVVCSSLKCNCLIGGPKDYYSVHLCPYIENGVVPHTSTYPWWLSQQYDVVLRIIVSLQKLDVLQYQYVFPSITLRNVEISFRHWIYEYYLCIRISWPSKMLYCFDSWLIHTNRKMIPLQLWLNISISWIHLWVPSTDVWIVAVPLTTTS